MLSADREGTGHALIGAREWIPAGHIGDPARSAVMGRPPGLIFRNKGELAIDILTEAFADGVRDLATFNTFDFVVIFLLSNVVQNAIIGNDDSLSGGIIGAAVLVAVNAAFNRWLAASSRASRLLEGKPTVLIEDGHHRAAERPPRQHRRRPGRPRPLGSAPTPLRQTLASRASLPRYEALARSP